MISIVVISKDETALDTTLTDLAAQARELDRPSEIVVVDASEARLDSIRRRHADGIRWVPFRPPPGVTISIPHQRNAGVREARGEIVVFTDAGCRPEPNWLGRLVAPLDQGEYVAAGATLDAAGDPGLHGRSTQQAGPRPYLTECATINLAFRRDAFDAVGGFDERFAYGSDVDFSWRLVEAGYRIRGVPDAVVRHDWGTWRRQLRRSYLYGRARARLYRKHRHRLRGILRHDPVVVLYPVFLLGLPLTLVFPLYPALLLIPAWRNRSKGAVRVLADHLTFGVGVLAEMAAR
jgi:cellulose synthase/poly-beta-1,6-N-acetylglucosamine synthase-like glycosyltransferase